MMAAHVGIMEIGRRRVQLERLAQAVPILREVDRHHGERARSAGLHFDRGERGGARPGRIVGDDWPLYGIAQPHGAGRGVLDGDRDIDRRKPLPPAVVAVAFGVGRIEFQDEQILLIDVEVGAAEGEAIGMALHDAREARRAAADHVQPRRGQMRDMARAEPADAEVRIVGQDRAPGRGPAARDRPGIGAGIGGVEQLVRVLRVRFAAERQRTQAQHAQIGLADLRGIEAVGHLERDRRAQRRHQPIEVEQP